ncbi:MAG: glycosyltransferase family 4 protein [Chloroflexi bacterium]|nr:glycosyltransferase family 4 protein [Chloroflexota bacterium]
MFSRIMPAHSPGGMQDHVQTLSAGLARRGHRVAVITSGRADRVEFDIVEGVEIHFLKGTPPGRNTNAYWFGAARRFQELHAVEPFDILHSQSVGAYGVYKKRLNRKHHLPLITSFHGTHLDVLTTSWHTDFSLTHPLSMARFFALAGNLLFRYLYRDLWFTRGSDVVIATSDADVWKYKTLYRLDDDRIRKVYNGIDTELFALRDPDGLREQLGLRADEKIILALARLEKDKGVQNAIEVMPRIVAQFPARLIVVGDGNYRAALERLARARGVAKHVRFVGAQSLSECARYFNLCDVFVDPTLRTDGYDLTIAEAMACQKPVVVSDVGANSTLIDAATRGDGILIPRGDNDALAREVLRLLGDPKLGKTMGEQARAKIVAGFSIPAMVEGMERVYTEFAASEERRALR